MNKSKKIISFVAAATLALSAFTLTGCSDEDYKGEINGNGYDATATVSSNGGFLVEKGDFVYFINGKDTNTADNTYGNVVKASLMRISKTQLAAGEYSAAQIVIPSLFVSGNYDAGVYIYGDKVYYATPTTDKNNAGEVENSYLDFKWSTLDGSAAPMGGENGYFLRLASNTTKYRFVEVDGKVYCMYEQDGALKSLDIASGVTRILVKGAGTFYYDTQDLTNPNVYYTMSVQYDVDQENPITASYNQIYSVNAAAYAVTDGGKASYKVFNGDTQIAEYDFDEAALNAKEAERKESAEEADIEDDKNAYVASDYSTYPYVNLGQLVLDGVGSAESFSEDTRYNKDDPADSLEPLGYTYTIQSHANDGLYFTRQAGSSVSGTATNLYYIPSERSDWNTVTGNASADIVSNDTATATSSALYEIAEDGTHTYLYLSGSILKRATTDANGVAEIVDIADGLSSITLWKTEGDYLYYYGAGTNGNDLSRINYKGEAKDYNKLLITDEYKPVTLSLVDWHDSWYKPEFVTVDGKTLVLYANAQSYGTGGTSYNYIYAAELGTTEEIIARNEKIEKVQEFIDSYKDNSELQAAMRYFYRTNKTEAFDKVADLYTTYQKDEFKAFTEKFAEGGEFVGMMESDFISLVGRMKSGDVENIDEDWADSLLSEKVTSAPEEEMPTWAIVLICCGSALALIVIIAIAVKVIKKKKAKKRREEAVVNAYKRKKIDTTDDKSIDVYADEEGEEAAEEEIEASAEEASVEE